MGYWSVIYKEAKDESCKVLYVPEDAISLIGRDYAEFAPNDVIAYFKKKFQKEIDTGLITSVKVTYCVDVKSVSVSSLASPKEPKGELF